MMFEGTPNAPKGVFDRVIEGGGGLNNGSTRYDYTNYIETAPVSALDAILWLEADRMKTLDFSEKNLKNQQEVVKEEIRVNVKNRPGSLLTLSRARPSTSGATVTTATGLRGPRRVNINDVEKFFNDYGPTTP
jgi:predicted Zn-dependent peptidase